MFYDQLNYSTQIAVNHFKLNGGKPDLYLYFQLKQEI